MKIGILGTRGIPNVYGGFEQFAQYLSVGLKQRGHEVFVYNSSDHPYRESQWQGVNIIHCRDWESRLGTAGQFFYDYNCLRDAAKRNFDILLQLGYTSNSVWYPIWPKNARNVVNMDGLEWKRSKYGPMTRKFLMWAETQAARHGDVLVADSLGIRDHIRERYGREAVFIPYGADIPDTYDPHTLSRWDLTPGEYYMLMARMEPENNIEMIIQGWMASDRKLPLVLVGNPGNRFGRYLTAAYRDENLRWVGAVYDPSAANALRHYSAFYFHGHSVGGTNPSLLEAMACGCRIAAHDNVFNKTVLEKDARYFSSAAEVTALLGESAGEAFSADAVVRNLEKLKARYRWENIIDAYEQLFARP
jgi:glycosyltransferase involved in cell wall biosynthesis